jgi:hypothetical protein
MMTLYFSITVIVVSMMSLSSESTESPLLLVELGTTAITSADVSYKMAVETAYGNATIDETGALVSLINDVFELEVGKMFGIAATPEEIAAFCRHVDETTKAPEILVQVKRIFQDDQSAYERLYITPKIINRKLRAWYSRSEELHDHARNVIEKAYYLVHSGKTFEQAAQACSLVYSMIEHDVKSDTMPQLLQEYFPEGSRSFNAPMQAIIESLSEGEIYKNIVEDDDSYKVIRLLQKDSTQYSVEAITTTKRPFMEWFQEQAAQIAIQVLDTELKEKIIEEYPHVWWIGH